MEVKKIGEFYVSLSKLYKDDFNKVIFNNKTKIFIYLKIIPNFKISFKLKQAQKIILLLLKKKK